MKHILIGALCFGLLIAIGCGKKGDGDKSAAPSDTVTTASGLKYVDIRLGDGESPSVGQNVEVHYTGWLLENGNKFDSSRDRDKPFTFPIGVGRVIKGWDEGVMSMKVGGQRHLIIPPELGYGPRGAGSIIPPDSWLVFDVELLKVHPQDGAAG